MTEPSESKPTTAATIAYDELCRHLYKWFYRPDIKAVEIVLATAASHYVAENDPIWMFVTGPASSGKTSIIVNSLRGLPGVHIMGGLTPKTLMSQYKRKGAGECALLHRIGKSGIMVFKDFTTFLSMKDDDKRIIASQLREVYDGEFRNDSGMGDQEGLVKWTGKVTVVGVCTTSLDRAWAFHRDMGERFLQVRWPRIDGIEMGLKASEQRGQEAMIYDGVQILSKTWLNSTPRRKARALPDVFKRRTASLAELVSRIRANVTRDSHGDRKIIDTADPEQAPRVQKQLELLIDTHAQLFEREPNVEDYRVGIRVAFDSIPAKRSKLLVAAAAPGGVTKHQLGEMTRIHRNTIDWNLEELRALDAIRADDGGGLGEDHSVISLSPWAREFYDDAMGKI